jgi:predicted GNAT family N-acyltransferase
MGDDHRVDIQQISTAEQLSTALSIRYEVFVSGQGVPLELERDGLDPDCLHLLAAVAGHPVGTARLREVHGTAKAERVAVLETLRGRGVGRELMFALEEAARQQGHSVLTLNAQNEAIPFYRDLGYEPEGELFQEAGIPHLAMRKTLFAKE